MKVLKECKDCGKQIMQVPHSQGICRSCAAKRCWKTRERTKSQESIEKMLKTQKEKYPERFAYETRVCACGKEFQAKPKSKRKYCSTDCQHKYYQSNWTKEKKENLQKSIAQAISEGRWRGHNSGVGGYRKDLQHYVRSTFEANYARILLYENKKYDFEKHHFKCKDGSIYIPDFYIIEENTFVEIKGRLSDTKGIKKFKEISEKETKYNWLFIGPDEYEELCIQYSNKIKNWETKKNNIHSENWSYDL